MPFPTLRRSGAAAALTAAALVVGLVAAPASAAPASAAPSAAVTAAAATTTPPAGTADLGGDTLAVPSWAKDRDMPGTRAAPGEPAVERLYVTVAAATSSTGDDTVTALDDASIRRAVADLSAFWSEESGGRVSVQLAAVEQRSLGLASCEANAAFGAARGLAHGGRFASFAWAGTHEHLLVLTREACGTKAFATVGGTGGEIFSSYGLGEQLGTPVLLHEFGHNLGLGHAGSAMCRSTTAVDGASGDLRTAPDASSTAQCPVEEYGDFSDIMGYSVAGARPHLSAPQRLALGWLPDAVRLAVPSARQRVVLGALDGRTGPRALTVVDPATGTSYVVEYRTASGRDATSTELRRAQPRCSTVGAGFTKCALTTDPATGGVRVLRTIGGAGTAVLAAGPVAGKGPSTRDTHLDAGERFTSAGGGVTVSVVSLSPTGGAVLDVAVGPQQAAATTTRLVLDRARQSHGAAGTATATSTVTVAGGAAPRGTVVLRDGTAVVAQGRPDASGALRTALPTTLPAGSRSLTATFTPDDGTQSSSTSAATAFTVDRATTTTTLRQSAASQQRGAASGVVLTATVAPVAGSAPAGTVTLTRDGTAVATVPVVGGTARWTVPAATPVGARRFVASFTPSSPSLTGSTSAAVTVTVRQAASATSVGLAQASVARGAAPVVRVAVTSPALPRPTGRITILVDGAAVATATLRESDQGRLSIALPRRARAGSVSVTASWSGTADVAGSTSAPVRMTVR